MMGPDRQTHRDVLTETQRAEMAAFFVDNSDFFTGTDESTILDGDGDSVFVVDHGGEAIEEWAGAFDVEPRQLREAFAARYAAELPGTPTAAEFKRIAHNGDDILVYDLDTVVADA